MARPATRAVRLIAVALAGALLAGCAAASGGAADGPGTVYVVNSYGGTLVATIAVGLGPTGVAVAPACTPNAGKVYVTNTGDGTVTVIEPDGTVAATVAVGQGPTGVVVAP